MTIRHLRIFIAVAETGKMSEAAKQLYIAQPTVSQVIGEIEEDYGVRLFERLSKKLFITEEGERLLRYARHITSLFDEMERCLRNSSNPVVLRVGATITVGSCVLAQILKQFEEQNPLADTTVVVDNTQIIEKMLLNSELDLALVEGEIANDELLVVPVIRDELVLACGNGHPFSVRENIRCEELEGQPFVQRERGSGTRARFEELIKSRDISINTKWVCYGADSILSAVEENHGLTVISRMLAQPWEEAGRLRIVPISDARMQRYFSLVYHKDKFLSEPLKKLIQTVKDSPYAGL